MPQKTSPNDNGTGSALTPGLGVVAVAILLLAVLVGGIILGDRLSRRPRPRGDVGARAPKTVATPDGAPDRDEPIGRRVEPSRRGESMGEPHAPSSPAQPEGASDVAPLPEPGNAVAAKQPARKSTANTRRDKAPAAAAPSGIQPSPVGSEIPPQRAKEDLQPGGVARSGDRPQLPSGDRPQQPTGDRPAQPVGDRPQQPEPLRPEPPGQTKNYLALLSPAEVVGVKTDAAAVRRKVVLSGKTYAFGLWAQPTEDRGTAQLSFLLNGKYTGLRGVAGICDAPAGGDETEPSGTLRIYGDGNLLWESRVLTGHGAVESFAIGVQGIELLALVVESDSPAGESQFAWGDVELTQHRE